MASEDVIPYNNLTLKPLFIEPVRTGRLGRRARSTRSVDARASERQRAGARFAGGHTRAAGGSEARRAARRPPGRKSARARSAAAAGPRRRGALCCAAPRPGNANGGTSGKETAPSRRNDHFEHSAHAETTVRWGLHIGSPQKQRVVPTTRSNRNRNGARRAGGRGRWAVGRLCATARAQRPCAAPGNPPRDRSGSGLCPPPARVAAAAHGEMNAPRERALEGKARIASRLDPARTRMGARRAAPMC